MSTHLLETGEEDYALVVVNFIAKLLDGGEQACSGLLPPCQRCFSLRALHARGYA